MNKELQNLAWSILPKEFKEEMKKIWEHENKELVPIDAVTALNEIFGHHNLTSDAEGEEMLTVPRKEVLNHFREACLDRIYYSNDSKDYAQATGRKIMLVRLFGKDKCLPDDKADEKVDDKNSPNADNSEQKPPEPKYHRGEKVRYNGCVYEVEGLVGKNRYALKGLNFDLDEDMIDPCTEPKNKDSEFIRAESVKESRIASEETHLRNLSQETANCDKQFDNILKDSLSKERRLNIAAMMAQGIMANSNPQMVEMNVERVVDLAILTADTLIAECEKGGTHD